MSVDDTTLSMLERAPTAKIMEPINELDETMLSDDLNTPGSTLERDQSDIIKVKKVCKCRCKLVSYVDVFFSKF